MNFRTAYDHPTEAFKTPVGSDELIDYMLDTSKGYKRLVERSRVSMTDYISSFQSETEVYSILNRCNVTGDYSGLSTNPGIYGDATLLPSNPAEALCLSRQLVQQAWLSLTDEQRKDYGSFDKFLSICSTDDGFDHLIGHFSQSDQSDLKEPVVQSSQFSSESEVSK